MCLMDVNISSPLWQQPYKIHPLSPFHLSLLKIKVTYLHGWLSLFSYNAT